MPGKHNAGGCLCCAPEECVDEDYCPDYEDDWTFIFCSLAAGGSWTYISGTAIHTFLNSYGAFNMTPVLTDDTGVSREYTFTKTINTGGTTIYLFGGTTPTVRWLKVTVVVDELCAGNYVQMSAICECFDGDPDGAGVYQGVAFFATRTSYPTNYTAGCGQVFERSNEETDQAASGGTMKGTPGVVSLSC